jgi:hypothetical protein
MEDKKMVKSNPEIAWRAEKIAMEQILSKLGFTELYHASAIKGYVPFDFVATHKGQRVLVDVATGINESLAYTSQISFADALRMPIYILFVKLDFSKFQLRLDFGFRTNYVHFGELVPNE